MGNFWLDKRHYNELLQAAQPVRDRETFVIKALCKFNELWPVPNYGYWLVIQLIPWSSRKIEVMFLTFDASHRSNLKPSISSWIWTEHPAREVAYGTAPSLACTRGFTRVKRSFLHRL